MEERLTFPTLAQTAWPSSSTLRDAILVLAGSALTALSAQISITLPFSPVPITGQTFAVLIVGLLLGSRRAGLAMLAYLFEGAVGLPVFAGGTSTLAILMGPTGGYLLGFLPAAMLAGHLAERGWDRSILCAAVAMVLGNLVIYAFGLARLAGFVGISHVLAFGITPFLVGDLLKIVLAALALPAAWRFAVRRGAVSIGGSQPVQGREQNEPMRRPMG